MPAAGCRMQALQSGSGGGLLKSAPIVLNSAPIGGSDQQSSIHVPVSNLW